MPFSRIVFTLVLAFQQICTCLRLHPKPIVDESFPPFPTWRYCDRPGCVFEPKEIDLFHIRNKGDVRLQHPWGSSNHCRLFHALNRAKRGENVSFTVTGGSASQGAGLNIGERNWIQSLDDDSEATFGFRMHIQNAAQGATESFWAASLLDSIVDRPDVIFWEYAINDRKGHSTGADIETPEYTRQAMDFFINKALQLPSKPALVFVYLYDAEKTKCDLSHVPICWGEYGEFYSTALEQQTSVLQRYADAGVDLLVLPVQGALREIHAENDMRMHHPGGYGHKAIAQFIAQQLQYHTKNMSEQACSAQQLLTDSDVKSIPMGSDVKNHPILHKLSQMSSKSDTPVKPRFGQSSLETHFCKLNNCSEVLYESYGKKESVRHDEKIGYSIPTCADDKYLRILVSNTTNMFRYLAPSSSIIALHLSGGGPFVNRWSHKVQICVEGSEPKVYDEPKCYVGESDTLIPHVFNLWIQIPSSSSYIKLCMPEQHATGNLQKPGFSPFSDGGGHVDWITIWT